VRPRLIGSDHGQGDPVIVKID